MQLLRDGTLVSGGADGRLLVATTTGTPRLQHRVIAHDASVVALQVAPSGRLALSAGADGRVVLLDVRTGKRVREVTERAETLWRIAVSANRLVVAGRRYNKVFIDVYSFRPRDCGQQVTDV